MRDVVEKRKERERIEAEEREKEKELAKKNPFSVSTGTRYAQSGHTSVRPP